MKASTLVAKLQELIETNGDLDLIYAKDDEGNGYDTISFSPSLFMRVDHNEYMCKSLTEECGIEFIPDVICIN